MAFECSNWKIAAITENAKIAVLFDLFIWLTAERKRVMAVV